MKTAVVIKHVAFEHLGSFASVLSEQGYRVNYVDACLDEIDEQVHGIDPDLLIVLGGPIGVYETDDYPFLTKEIALLKKRLATNKPTLGICLGAQLIAAALGATVYSSGHKEIGWSPITLSPAGADSPLRFLGDGDNAVLHWHGDTFTLPDGAVHLASTPVCKNQAFSYGSSVLALQFHPEILQGHIDSWLVGHACEIAGAEGVTVQALRDGAGRHAALLEQQSRVFFDSWLTRVSPATTA